MSRPTLRSLARELSLSANSVSKALRGTGSLSERTRLRVRALAKKRGYHLDPLTSRMMSTLRKGVGVVRATLGWIDQWPTPGAWQTRPYLKRYWQGALQRAEELGYGLDIIEMPEANWNGRRLHQILRARGIESLILSARHLAGHEWSLPWSDYHLVAMEDARSDLCLTRVGLPAGSNFCVILDQIERLEFQRAAYIRFVWSAKELDRFAKRDLLFWESVYGKRSTLVLRGEGPKEKEQFLGWARKYRPDAVISNSFRPRQWLSEIGIKHPDEVACFHSDVGGQENPADWAGLDQRTEQIGAACIEQLARRVESGQRGLNPDEHLILVPGRWVWGGGIGPGQ